MKKLPIQINLRKLMGDMSEGELSRRTKVPQTTIHRILTGEIRESKPSTLKPLADYFGLTIAQLSERKLEDRSQKDIQDYIFFKMISSFGAIHNYTDDKSPDVDFLDNLEKHIKINLLILQVAISKMKMNKE